jgi:hypothetical protein
MLSFFTHAENVQDLSGSTAYLESIQRLFVQDQSSGLIEVALPDGEHLIYLYYNGSPLLVHHQKGSVSELLDPAARYLDGSSEVRFRYMSLPDQAVRAVWQALSWGDAGRQIELKSYQLADTLANLYLEHFSGLMYCRLADWDGFLLLDDGNAVGAETILASAHGFIESFPNLHNVHPGTQEECLVWLIESKPETLAGKILIIRLATADWIGELIHHYQSMVGSNLVIPLNHVMNTWFRQHRYNARLVSASLIDHHIPLSVDESLDMYRNTLMFLQGEIAKVIGDSLAQRAVLESYRKLKMRRQANLAKFGLTPVEAGVK